jgi:hypothetical protein
MGGWVSERPQAWLRLDLGRFEPPAGVPMQGIAELIREWTGLLLITGNGSDQALVAERPVVLPPATGREFSRGRSASHSEKIHQP